MEPMPGDLEIMNDVVSFNRIRTATRMWGPQTRQ